MNAVRSQSRHWGYFTRTATLSVIVLLSARCQNLAQFSGWTSEQAMPTARTLPGGCVLGGRIYITGGAVNEFDQTSVVEVYDPVAMQWSQAANLPSQLCAHATCAVGTNIYVFGGFHPTTSSRASKQIYVYDSHADTWERKADMRSAHAWGGIAVVDETVFLLGGCDYAVGTPFSRVLAYDPTTDSWSQRANMPTARSGLSACVLNGKIYAIGGTAAGYQSLDCVEVYDPVSDRWDSLTRMPTRRFAVATCVANGLIHAIGGFPSGVGAHEVYDPRTDSWTRATPLQQRRLGMVVSRIGHQIYAIGGSWPDPRPTTFSTTERYDTWPIHGPVITLLAAGVRGGNLELRIRCEDPFPESAATLQESIAIQGPWRDIVFDGQRPTAIPAGGPTRFYRVWADMESASP